jgi:hypothetical protein
MYKCSDPRAMDRFLVNLSFISIFECYITYPGCMVHRSTNGKERLHFCTPLPISRQVIRDGKPSRVYTNVPNRTSQIRTSPSVEPITIREELSTGRIVRIGDQTLIRRKCKDSLFHRCFSYASWINPIQYFTLLEVPILSVLTLFRSREVVAYSPILLIPLIS